MCALFAVSQLYWILLRLLKSGEKRDSVLERERERLYVAYATSVASYVHRLALPPHPLQPPVHFSWMAGPTLAAASLSFELLSTQQTQWGLILVLRTNILIPSYGGAHGQTRNYIWMANGCWLEVSLVEGELKIWFSNWRSYRGPVSWMKIQSLSIAKCFKALLYDFIGICQWLKLGFLLDNISFTE